ncbi:MAG: glycosyltransferase family 4 protein [Nanoarchaeota archaeon]
MRILIINHEFPPLGGGGGNANYYIARELVKLGHEVDVVTSAFANLKSETIDGFRVHRIKTKRKKETHATAIEMLSFSKSAYAYCKKLMKQKNYDVIQCFFTLPAGLTGYFLSKKFKKPMVIRMGGSDVPGYDPYRFGTLYKLLMPVYKKVWNHADKLIVNSQKLKDLLLKSKQMKVGIIYNGVDSSEMKPKRNSDGKTIICTSRLVKRKGIDCLLRALKDIKEFRLLLIGDGPEKTLLEQLTKQLGIEKNVHFIGTVPHNKIINYLNKSDIFVLPSFAEGMSNALLEAISSGLPAVITDVGGSRELVKNNGVIIEPGNEKQLKDALEKLLNSKKLRDEMSKESLIVAKKFTWENIAKEYENLYKELI